MFKKIYFLSFMFWKNHQSSPKMKKSFKKQFSY